MRPRARARCAFTALVALGACAFAPARAAEPAPVPARGQGYPCNGLVNGDFAAPVPATADVPPGARVPGWRTSDEGARVVKDGEDTWLELAPGAWAEQPFAAYSPSTGDTLIRGFVQGAVVVEVVDGQEGVASFPFLGRRQGEWFSIDGAAIARALGRSPVPRFTLRFVWGAEGPVRVKRVDAQVLWPDPYDHVLRADVVAVLDGIFRDWEARALDERGPRRTAFVARTFDVVSGAELAPLARAPVFSPLHTALLAACTAEPRPEWSAFLARYLEDVFAHGLHPDTGLPCAWDPAKDEPIADVPMEVALPLGFLIDVAREGPVEFRGRATDAARRIGDVVLARGLLPDGGVAASYLPRDGTPNLDVSHLRRLDVPAQLARLARLVDDARYAAPAREALAALEYAHHWSGTWDAIDPAFDDEFGHYGARAAAVALARPDEIAFRRFAVEGLRHFLPLWRDALLLGGNVAADQVRCWSIAADLVELDPTLRPDVAAVLPLAVHAHVRGQQYGNGAWGDVTHYRFDPRTALQVGDLTGTPQNLLSGLAALYGRDAGVHDQELIAYFAAVLRSTIQEYGRPHGFLATRTEQAGGTNAAGSLRILLGLTTMLRRLSKVEDGW